MFSSRCPVANCLLCDTKIIVYYSQPAERGMQQLTYFIVHTHTHNDYTAHKFEVVASIVDFLFALSDPVADQYWTVSDITVV